MATTPPPAGEPARRGGGMWVWVIALIIIAALVWWIWGRGAGTDIDAGAEPGQIESVEPIGDEGESPEVVPPVSAPEVEEEGVGRP